MNLQSEIAYYSEIRIADKARLMASFLSRAHGRSARHLRRVATTPCTTPRTCGSSTRCAIASPSSSSNTSGDDKARPADDVVLRMLLSPRADKVAEKMVHTAYRRALQNFERYDTTVFMNS